MIKLMCHVICFAAILFIVPACSNTSSKPSFNTSYFSGLESTTITDYKSTELNYDLTGTNGKKLHFTSCVQVDNLKETDVATFEYHLYTYLKLNCNALYMLLAAKPSKVSYLDKLLTTKDISLLPATIYPYSNNDDKTARTGKTLKQHHSELSFKVLDDGSVDALTVTDTLIYQILSTGDFNNDGIQDALIRIDWHVLNAFGKGSRLFLVTRMSKGAPIIDLELKP